MGVTLPSVGQIFTAVGAVLVDVEVDEGELAAGTPVTVPIDLTIGSINGKPVYAQVSLTTTKPA